MPVRSFNAISIDPDPNTVAALPVPGGVSAFSRNNWRNSIRVTTEWPTELLNAQIDDAGQRSSLQPRPVRSVTSFHSSMTQDALSLMYQEQFALQTQAYTALPVDHEFQLETGRDAVWQEGLFSDQATVISASGLNVFFSGIETRRFYVGQRVFLFPDCAVSEDLEIAGPYGVNHVLGEIATISADKITLVNTPSVTVQPGWGVCPAIDCLALSEVPESVLTPGGVELSITAQERNGPSVLPSSVDPTIPLTGWDQHSDGRYILTARHNFAFEAAAGFERTTATIPSGLAGFVHQKGQRAKRYWDLVTASIGREDFWKFLQFWDWHLGPVRSFWFIYSRGIWTQNIETVSTVRIRAHRRGNRVLFQANQKAVALTNTAGDVEIRTIAGISEAVGGLWDMTFTAALPGGFVVSEVRPASLAIFGDNSMDEDWIHPELCTMSATISEIDNEATVELL